MPCSCRLPLESVLCRVARDMKDFGALLSTRSPTMYNFSSTPLLPAVDLVDYRIGVTVFWEPPVLLRSSNRSSKLAVVLHWESLCVCVCVCVCVLCNTRYVWVCDMCWLAYVPSHLPVPVCPSEMSLLATGRLHHQQMYPQKQFLHELTGVPTLPPTCSKFAVM